MRSKLILLALIHRSLGLQHARTCPIAASIRSTFRSSPGPDYALDPAAPGGSLPSSEAGRLDGCFPLSMQLGYGDNIYVDGADAYEVGSPMLPRVAGRYGMLVTAGAPVTAGVVQPGYRPGGRQLAAAPRCRAAPTGAARRHPTSTTARCRTTAAR